MTVLILCIIFTFFNILTEEKGRNLINNFSEIHLVIQGTGVQNLLNNEYRNEPSEVLINEILKDCTKSCNIESDIYNNKIILRFEEQIDTCEKMFCELTNIKEIDLTYFDASKVTSMNKMFYGCINLEKINFGNINTSSVKNMNYLFYNCSSLIFLELSSFNTSIVEEMENLFGFCSNLKFLDLSNFDISKVTTINSMFEKCSLLIFLNLKSFIIDASINISNAFNTESSYIKYCIEDINTINHLSGIININCTDICFQENMKIDITNNICIESCLNTENNYEYNNICYNKCPKGTLVNNNICEDNLCNKEIQNEIECLGKTPQGYYLDLSDELYKKCFENCKFCYGQGNKTINNCIECESNLVLLNESFISTNCYNKCKTYYYFDESNEYHCAETCTGKYYKLIREKSKCIEDCNKDDLYKYEYKNECYLECPLLTNYNTSNNICYDIELIFPDFNININDLIDLTDLIIIAPHDVIVTSKIIQIDVVNENDFLNKTDETTKKVNVDSMSFSSLASYDNFIIDSNLEDIVKENNFLNKTSQTIKKVNIVPIMNISVSDNYILDLLDLSSYGSYDNFSYDSNLEVHDSISKDMKRIFINGFNSSIVDEGKDLTLIFDQIIYSITSTLNQVSNKIKDMIIIDLGECENKLKEKYNISLNDSLYLYKIDNLFDPTPKIEYEVYYPFSSNNFTQLDLSICQNTKVEVSIPAKISPNDIDKYNKSSPLYNDICYTAKSETGTDITLKDRQNEFRKNNMSLCEEGCDFVNYDSKYNKAICSCFIN